MKTDNNKQVRLRVVSAMISTTDEILAGSSGTDSCSYDKGGELNER